MWTTRTVVEDDHPSILLLVREAFSGPGRNGQEEVVIVGETWHRKAAITGLELVAVADDGAIVGHVLGARGAVAGRDVVAVAPLAVAPARQRQGVGTALMTRLVEEADRQGWPAVVLLGDPGYYRRFGFEPAGAFGIVYRPVGPNDPSFQVRRLSAYDPAIRGDMRYCWEPADAPPR